LTYLTFIRFDEKTTSLFEIFKTYGTKGRKDAPEFTLYYNFHPYNSTEPILLALTLREEEIT
jgi:hypothetical protein